jgi:hypothetical protein
LTFKIWFTMALCSTDRTADLLWQIATPHY